MKYEPMSEEEFNLLANEYRRSQFAPLLAQARGAAIGAVIGLALIIGVLLHEMLT
mgnify:CR=1 FL=1